MSFLDGRPVLHLDRDAACTVVSAQACNVLWSDVSNLDAGKCACQGKMLIKTERPGKDDVVASVMSSWSPMTPLSSPPGFVLGYTRMCRRQASPRSGEC
jgi:hypothetical protein